MKWIGINSTSDTSLADITSIVAGTGLTGGATSGDATLALAAGLITDGSNITSVGTLGALQVDNVNVNGNTVSCTSGDLTIQASNQDIVVDANTVQFSTTNTATAALPSVSIIREADDSDGSRFQLIKDRINAGGARQAGEDDDLISAIQFKSYNDNDTPVLKLYGDISAKIHDATDGEESGKLELGVANHDGGLGTGLTLLGGNVNNEVDVIIGLGTSSVTSIAGTLSMAGEAIINNSGVIQVAAQTVIDHDQLANFAANEHFTQANITTVGTISTGEWRGAVINHAYIDDDAIDGDNIADDAVDSEHYTDGSIDTAHIADDQVTFAKAIGVSPKVYGTKIKILPSDFMSNDDGGSTKFGIGFVETDSTAFGMKIPNANTELLAFVSIPEGMKATHVDIFDQGDNKAIEVFEANVNSRTITSKGSGSCNTTLDITDVNATAVNYLLILVTTTATSNRTYGGTITIAAQ